MAPELAGHMPIMTVHGAGVFRKLDPFCPFICIVVKGVADPLVLAINLISCEDVRLG